MLCAVCLSILFCSWLVCFKFRPSSSKNTSFRTSVRSSVCPSVIPVWQWSFHRIIQECSGVITIDWCDVHANDQGQRSKVNVTKVMTQISRFRTVTPVWVHIWRRNDTQGLKQHRSGSLLFSKVIRQISRSQIVVFYPKLGVSGL